MWGCACDPGRTACTAHLLRAFWHHVPSRHISNPSLSPPAPQNIPGWWIWCYYLSPVSWSLYGLIVSQLGDLDDSYILDFSGQVVPVPEFIEDYLGYSYDMLWPCVGILLAFIVVFLLISGLSLKLINYQHR